MAKSVTLQHKATEPSPITVKRPEALASRLFFRVYSGPTPIGFAFLSTRQSAEYRRLRSANTVKAPGVSYVLKTIEVSQHYRRQGVGTRLLEEVIGFCREQRVATLYGEAKGSDPSVLRRWYQSQGFTLNGIDNIHIAFDQ